MPLLAGNGRNGRRSVWGTGGHHPPREKDESEVRWLISYSDFMMQLVCLFILLYSVSSTDKAKAGEIAEAWREHQGLPPLTAPANPPDAVHPPLGSADIAPAVRELEVAAGRFPEGRHLRILPSPGGVRLRFDHGMFAEGSSQLTPEGRTLLDFAAALLKPLAARVLAVELEGHAAAEDAEREDGSALRLSLSRSREAYRWLARPESPQRLPAERMTASGRGPHAPAADNRDPAGHARNRRVELVVMIK